ncbi:MAG: alpha/beta fold hydrolase, partial [Bryobacteraceae bacterium]
GTERSAMLACLAAPGYLVGPMFAIVGLLPMFVPPLWVFVLLLGAYVPGLIVVVVRAVSKVPDGPSEVTPDGCWHGSFYYNPQDPALFVGGRTGFGLTANFARRLVWLLLAIILLVTVGLLLLGSKLLAQTATAPEDVARQTVVRLVDGKYDELYQSFSADMRAALSLEALKSQIGPQVSAFGKLIETRKPAIQQIGGNTVLIVPAKFQTLWIDFTISVNGAGQVAGLFMKPGQAPDSDRHPPAYSKPDSFSERAVTVGAGDWKLPGTLTLPRSQTPVPGVVLIHGSGPEDRDETSFGNKPFRDLAEGLASQGIAVLRYEKRTKEYEMAQMRNLTVQEETVEDAVAAVTLLRAQPGIDPKRVFLLGHSLGGYLMPMMLDRAPEAAGGIVLGGNARPLDKLALSVKALQPGHEDGPAILGAFPHYWLDLRGYDPVAQAAKITRPLLILQGERDYQVTMKDFEIWKAALAGHANVTLKSYPALNHLFVEGKGKSVPAEYMTPGHVSGEAIGDIARWILAR